MHELPTTDLQTFRMMHAVRRHLVLVVLATLVCAVAAGAFGFLRPQSYTSSATVFIQPLLGNALTDRTTDSNQSVTVAMETEANLATSAAVTERVNDATDSALKDSTTAVAASVPTNTQLVKISYTANSAAEARRFAQAYAEAYLAERQQLAQTTVQSQLGSLNKQVASIQPLLAQATRDAAAAHPSPDAGSRVQLYSSRLAALQSDIGQVQATDTFPGDIAVPAALPAAGGRLMRIVIALIGALVGLVLGGLLAVWRERRNDGIHSDLETAVHGLPVLASVQSGRGLDDPDAADAYRRLRVGVLASAAQNTVVTVSPVSTRESSAEIAVNLARSLSASGYRVALVDTVVEDPSVDRLLDVESQLGLSDVLLTGDPVDVVTTDADGMTVLTAGSDPVGARDRYSGEAIGQVLRELKEIADFVVLAGAPLTTGDGLAAVLAADHVAFVVTEGASTHAEIADAHDLVTRLSVKVLGLVALRRRSGRRSERGRAAVNRAGSAQQGQEPQPARESPQNDEEGADEPPVQRAEAGPVQEDAEDEPERSASDAKASAGSGPRRR